MWRDCMSIMNLPQNTGSGCPDKKQRWFNKERGVIYGLLCGHPQNNAILLLPLLVKGTVF